MKNKVLGACAVIVCGVILPALFYVVAVWAQGFNLPDAVGLPLLIIAGVLLMIAFLALAAVAFALFGLDDKTQALALPEGSVRAVIALSLVLLFAILSVYLYGNMAASGQIKAADHLPAAAAARLVKLLPAGAVIQVADSKQASLDATPAAIMADQTNAPFTITYQENHAPASDDFARQLLVMIGTLVTSVASFYFGSRAVASAQSDSAPPVPAVTGIAPATVPLGSTATSFKIAGSNLNGVIGVTVGQDKTQIVGNHVLSNANSVECQVDLGKAAAGDWDVVVTDAFGQQSKLAGGLKVTPPVASAAAPPGGTAINTGTTAAAESIAINGGTVVSGGTLAAGQTAATPGTV